MIRKQGDYVFTEAEKARIKRRRADSQKVREIFDRWYKGINLFPYHLHRSKIADYGPDHAPYPVTDCTIIKYGLYTHENKSLFDMFKLDDDTLMGWLKILQIRLAGYFPVPTFRIKVVREINQYKQVTEGSFIQIIFVELNDCYKEVKGEPISITTVDKKEDGDELFPW